MTLQILALLIPSLYFHWHELTNARRVATTT
jgi:hypothetical protein